MSSLGETQAAVAGALAQVGLRGDQVYVTEPLPDAPLPPEGTWVVLATGGTCTVGAVGRGQFRSYAEVASGQDAADLAVTLLTTRPPSRPAPTDDALAAGGATTARAIRARTAARGGQAGLALLEPGDLLDAIGPETGHHLYALGTPLPERSQPPTEGGAYHRFSVAAAMPDAQEGLAAPWFEQPGGGAMVVLARPVRWYADEGYLIELV